LKGRGWRQLTQKGDYLYFYTKFGRKVVLLHRFIMDANSNSIVDHKNQNTLDNRRENLRVCSRAQNNRNRTRNTNNISGYKGVSYYKRHKAWVSKDFCQWKTLVFGIIQGAVVGHIRLIVWHPQNIMVNLVERFRRHKICCHYSSVASPLPLRGQQWETPFSGCHIKRNLASAGVYSGNIKIKGRFLLWQQKKQPRPTQKKAQKQARCRYQARS